MLANYNTRALHNILGTTVSSLLNWLDTTCFTYEHAITFFHRPCPATLSFHYPLHRNFALILNAFLRRDSKLSSNGLCKALFASIENDAVKGDSRKGESAQEAKTEIGAHSKWVQNEMLRIIEHPLLTFIFMYQIYSQKWARNGRAMLIQLLYLRNHYWHDYTVQMDFF